MEEIMKLIRLTGVSIAFSLFLAMAGCSPEVGSEAWCEDMRDKPRKEWSASDAADYAKHCLFR
ncbi:DUF3012 domain-containing protein [Desulfuromonas sp. TF]|uniref:DUF3012 domain-containing protein n=1 Tax=Desulfuromonas sp. TF TaxID=1232410 RepID=UPI003510BDBD